MALIDLFSVLLEAAIYKTKSETCKGRGREKDWGSEHVGLVHQTKEHTTKGQWNKHHHIIRIKTSFVGRKCVMKWGLLVNFPFVCRTSYPQDHRCAETIISQKNVNRKTLNTATEPDFRKPIICLFTLFILAICSLGRPGSIGRLLVNQPYWSGRMEPNLVSVGITSKI